jgi:hypothetical protein
MDPVSLETKKESRIIYPDPVSLETKKESRLNKIQIAFLIFVLLGIVTFLYHL